MTDYNYFGTYRNDRFDSIRDNIEFGPPIVERIKCFDCKIEIDIQDAKERSDGNLVCEDCFKDSLEFND